MPCVGNLQNAFCRLAVDINTVVCEAYVKCRDIEMLSIEEMLSTGCSHRDRAVLERSMIKQMMWVLERSENRTVDRCAVLA